MKKFFVCACMLFFALVMNGQHVNPLQITNVEFDLQTLRQESADLAAYTYALQHIRLEQESVGKQLKEAEKELKEEQKHLKSLKECQKSSEKAVKSLRKSYESERKTLNSLSRTYSKYATTARRSNRLEENTRDGFLDYIAMRQATVEYMERSLKERIEYLDSQGENLKHGIEVQQQFELELKQKELDLKQLQETHRSRTDIIKAELKSVSAQMKAADKK